MKRFSLFIQLIFFLNCASGQVDTAGSRELLDTYDPVFENNSDEANQQLIVDDLEFLSAHPVHLRTATYFELTRVPFISPFLAEKIILLRDTVELVSIDSLRLIPECTDELLSKISPFITAEDPSLNQFSLTPSFLRSRSRSERRLQATEGFRENKYLGDQNSVYQKMQTGNSFFEIGSVFKKDIAEQYSSGFMTGYFSVRNAGFLKKFILGSYSFSAGQGLLTARNIGPSKGGNTVGQIRGRAAGLSPSLSVDESRFYYGGGAVANILSGTLVMIYSKRSFPASIDSLNTITSIYSSGLFRTASDLAKKDAAEETIIGGVFSTELFPLLTMGGGILHFSYDKNISSRLYNFGAKRDLTAGSFFGDYQIGSVNIFGEIASNEGINVSSNFGVILEVSKEVSLSYHQRAYSTRYTNPIAKPFGERDNIGDGETGNYLGLQLRPFRALQISSYADFYTLPSPAEFSAHGIDYFIQAKCTIFRNLELNGHVKIRRKDQYFVRENDDQRMQTNYRIGYKYRLFPGIVLSQRVEFVAVQYAPSFYREKGMGLFIDVSARRKSFPVSGNVRYILFDTKSYDSRFYQYETDVRGGYSNPPLFGTGNRWYCLLRYDIDDQWSFSIRYSETKKLNEYVIGSGDDEIAGNLDNQITVQLDFEL